MHKGKGDRTCLALIIQTGAGQESVTVVEDEVDHPLVAGWALLGCWALRYGKAELYFDGQCEYNILP